MLTRLSIYNNKIKIIGVSSYFFLIFIYNSLVIAMDKKPYHHLPDGTFRNPEGSPVRVGKGKFSYTQFIKLKKKIDMTVPEEHLVNKEKVLSDLEKYKKEDYIAWIGHATFLIKLGDTTIITDPVFSKNAGPLIFGPDRFTEPALKLNEIPKTDLFLLTHNHYDHQDMGTIRRFPFKDSKVLVPLNLGKYFTRNKYKGSIMTDQAMILAAGRGKRMMPLTRDIPKPMLRIGNMTLIEDKIIRLSEAGIKKIVINTGYLGSYIHEHVGDGSKYGIEIIISDEGDMPNGTANGIRNIIHEFNEKPFIVVNADIWTNYLFIDLLNMKLKKKTLAHLVLTTKPEYLSGDFNIENDEKIKGDDYIYTGIGLYRPELFLNYMDKELGTILRKEINIGAELYKGLWDDVGTPDRLNMIRKRISL